MKLSILLSALGILVLLLILFANTFVLNVIGGRVRFPDKHLGRVLTMEDGKKFTVFRRLRIEGPAAAAGGYAVFKVRFQFKSFGPSINKRLSLIPAPFLMGMGGFREKYWTIDEKTGFFQGIYQWESKAYAETYPGSFIFKLMTSRSVEGTLAYEIIPETDLSKYIEERLSASSAKKVSHSVGNPTTDHSQANKGAICSFDRGYKGAGVDDPVRNGGHQAGPKPAPNG